MIFQDSCAEVELVSSKSSALIGSNNKNIFKDSVASLDKNIFQRFFALLLLFLLLLLVDGGDRMMIEVLKLLLLVASGWMMIGSVLYDSSASMIKVTIDGFVYSRNLQTPIMWWSSMPRQSELWWVVFEVFKLLFLLLLLLLLLARAHSGMMVLRVVCPLFISNF